MAPTKRDGDDGLLGNKREENLGPQYSAAADDATQSERGREAAMLYSMAEGQMGDDSPEEALDMIKNAITIFREVGDAAGVADAVRLQMQAYRALAEHEHEEGRGTKEERLLQEAEALMREELSRFRAAGDKRGEASALLAVAQALAALGGSPRWSEALECLLDAQDLAAQIGDVKLQGNIFYERSRVLSKRQRFKEATQAAREALNSFRGIGDIKNEGYASVSLGSAQVANGRVEEGFVTMRRALNIFRRIGNRKMEGTTLCTMATWYMDECSDPLLAFKMAEEAVSVFKLMRDVSEELVACRLSAEYRDRIREHTKAMSCARDCLERAREANLPKAAFKAVQLICELQISAGQKADALETAEELVELARDMGDKRWAARALLVMGNAHQAEGEYDKAEECTKNAVQIFEDMPRYEDEWFLAIQTLGQIRVKKDEYDGSLTCMEIARKIAQKVEDTNLEASALLGLSGSYWGLDDLPQAKKAAYLARELFHEEGSRRSEARVLKLAISDYLIEEGKIPEAERAIQDGILLVEEAGDNKMICIMRQRLAEVLSEQGKHMEAASAAMRALKSARQEDDKLAVGSCLFQLISSNYAMMCNVPQNEHYSKNYLKSVERLARFAKETLTLGVKARDIEMEAGAQLWVARVALMQGREREALQAAQTALELARQFPDEDGFFQVDARLVMAAVQDAVGDAKTAKEMLVEVWQEAHRVGHETAMESAAQLLEQFTGGEVKGGIPAALARPDMLVASDKEVRARFDPATVRQHVTELVQMMGDTKDPIGFDTPIAEVGVDSLAAVELRTQLQQEYRINLPATVMYQHPTINAISNLLVEEASSSKHR